MKKFLAAVWDIVFWVGCFFTLVWCFFLIQGKNFLSDFFRQGNNHSPNQYSKNSKTSIVSVRLEVRKIADATTQLIKKINDGNPQELPVCPDRVFEMPYLGPCWANINYGGGDKYVGEWRENRPHGIGTMIYKDGHKYVGRFSEGKKDGLGEYTEPDTGTYLGEFKNGGKNGTGMLTYFDGEMYVGEFKDDKLHGIGYRYKSDGTIKDSGVYEEGKLLKPEYAAPAPTLDLSFQEKITQNIANQVDQLISKFDSGNPGSLKSCPDGKPHQKYNCWGYYRSANGEKYVGEFRDGKAHGLGRAALADGVKYVGEFKDGKAHGLGRLMYANGDEYIGEFKDGNAHGRVAHYYLANNRFKGDKYVGEFKDGKKHGQGTHIFINGKREIREYKNGLFDGRVIGYLADGNIEYSKIYQNGKLIKSEDVDPDIFMRAAKWFVGLRSSNESVDDNRAARPH